ncbi:MAG: FAD-dependent oxidoreductase [Candidatus Binatia bacterium]
MRVAVLGGGMGGLSAAWELARQGHQVTVYQTGWRLGGKGASGREAQFQQRIHEHGLHVLMGFYDQAFTLLRDVYAEAHKAPTFPNGKPLPWANAVEGWDTCVFSRQRSGGAWSFFDVDFPPAAGNPWDGVRPSPDFTDLFKAGVQVLLAIYAQLKGLIANPWLDAAVEAAIKALLAIAGALTAAMRLTLAAGLQKALGLVIATVINAGSLKSERDEWLFIAFCFAAANALGMLRDDLVKPSPDFASIDHYDYRDWLGSALDPTGCPDWASRQSPFVTALYDLAFSRERTLAAGVTLKVLLRLGLHYRGHLSFRMAAGMGDIVFAPFYIALKQQLGVQFRFFHRVKALRLDAGKTRIDSVEIERQVGQWNGYDPLVDVNGLACWPHEPKTALLDAAYQGDYAAAGNVMPYDFERDPAPSKYRPENTFTITRGTDFDVVVLAIPVGAHAPVRGDLIAAHPGFRDHGRQPADHSAPPPCRCGSD